MRPSSPCTVTSGARVGHPASLVDDECVAMLAGAQRERHGPATRAFIAHERDRRLHPSR